MTPDENEPRTAPWGTHTLGENEDADIDVGPLTLHLVRTAGEIRLAHSRDEEERTGAEAAGAATPTELEAGAAPTARSSGPGAHDPLDWSRWAGADWTGEITLTPQFPDRPVVVAPEEPFHLVAGANARIYVRVPLWVRIEAAVEGGTSTLVTLPSIPASDTWWGTFEEGELCYWLTTHARRSVSEDLFQTHLAMCPLQLVNRSQDDLTVDKIALRVDYLGLYCQGSRIWSDETRVRYQGDVEGSRLDMAGRPPAEAPDARQMAPARLKMARGFRARTFARFLSIQGWMT